jgi:hypothetical protein
VYERGGLCINQHDAGGPVGQYRDDTIVFSEEVNDKKRKQRPWKRCYDLQKLWFGKSLHDDEEKCVCDSVLACYYICFNCVFPFCFLFPS